MSLEASASSATFSFTNTDFGLDVHRLVIVTARSVSGSYRTGVIPARGGVVSEFQTFPTVAAPPPLIKSFAATSLAKRRVEYVCNIVFVRELFVTKTYSPISIMAYEVTVRRFVFLFVSTKCRTARVRRRFFFFKSDIVSVADVSISFCRQWRWSDGNLGRRSSRLFPDNNCRRFRKRVRSDPPAGMTVTVYAASYYVIIRNRNYAERN